MSGRVFVVPIVLIAGTLSGVIGARAARAQEAGRTVADGVYTDAQAGRGAAAYELACSNCHRADLSGASAPALKEQRFARMFADKDLRTLFTKIATTMPRGNPASLTDDVYLDIVAHLLKENGFKAASVELTADALDGIRVVAGRPKPPPAVGDFSYVEVVGCLTRGPRQTWLLTRATEPVAVTPSAAAPTAPAASTKPLGTLTFRLPDAMAYNPDRHTGHKMYVRGLLIKLPGDERMTISTFEMVAATCSE